MYAEVEREKKKIGKSVKVVGPPAAKGNIRLGHMLLEAGIGPTKLRFFLAALGMRPISLTHLQRLTTTAADKTVTLNEEDMDKWLKLVEKILKERGVEDTKTINVSSDGRYDGTRKVSSTTPGRGCSSSTAAFIEQTTGCPKVVEMEYGSKRCPKGTRLLREGFDSKCGQKNKSHDGCRANMPYRQDFSERIMSAAMTKRIYDKHGIEIANLTSDSDSKLLEGIRDAYRKRKVKRKVNHFKDLWHTSGCQRRRVNSYKFGPTAFGHKPNGEQWNTEERRILRRAFAYDIAARCAKTMRHLHAHYKDTSQIAVKIDNIRDLMIACYSGEHKKCKSTRLAKLTGCTGKDGQTWFDKSKYLRPARLKKIYLSKAEKTYVTKVISLRLSRQGLKYHKHRLTSSQCESLWRSVNCVDPKSYVFSSTGRGRNSAAVHGVNNDRDNSIRAKLAYAKCSLPAGGYSDRVLADYGKKTRSNREYKATRKAMKRRSELNDLHTKEYFENCHSKNRSDYLKDQKNKTALNVTRSQDRIRKTKLAKYPVPSSSIQTSCPELQVPCTSGTFTVTKQYSSGKDKLRWKKSGRPQRLKVLENQLAANEELAKKAETELSNYIADEKEKKARTESEENEQEEINKQKRVSHYNTGSLSQRTLKQEHSYHVLPGCPKTEQPDVIKISGALEARKVGQTCIVSLVNTRPKRPTRKYREPAHTSHVSDI